MKVEQNYYKILGVHEQATNHELRKAFCRLTKELHPDTTSLLLEEARFKLQLVLEAYENLNNPNLRNLYDLKLKNIKNLKTENSHSNFGNSFDNSKIETSIGHRRPFSDGEMFSLLLLTIVICLSLVLFLLFAYFTGKEVNSIPIWLVN